MWETDGFFGVDSTPSLTNRDFGPEERGQNAFAWFFGGTCSCHMWLTRVPEHEPAQYSKKKCGIHRPWLLTAVCDFQTSGCTYFWWKCKNLFVRLNFERILRPLHKWGPEGGIADRFLALFLALLAPLLLLYLCIKKVNTPFLIEQLRNYQSILFLAFRAAVVAQAR